MSKIIDAMGQCCPIPVLMAKEAIADGEAFFTIDVDNQTSVENLKRLAASQGFSAVVREGEGRFSLDFL
ncbi:MAG: sulfurtransferase TusA family protein, partial [Lawsonibacter sp.]